VYFFFPSTLTYIRWDDKSTVAFSGAAFAGIANRAKIVTQKLAQNDPRTIALIKHPFLEHHNPKLPI
jgi:hypothetical protein